MSAPPGRLRPTAHGLPVDTEALGQGVGALSRRCDELTTTTGTPHPCILCRLRTPSMCAIQVKAVVSFVSRVNYHLVESTRPFHQSANVVQCAACFPHFFPLIKYPGQVTQTKFHSGRHVCVSLGGGQELECGSDIERGADHPSCKASGVSSTLWCLHPPPKVFRASRSCVDAGRPTGRRAAQRPLPEGVRRCLVRPRRRIRKTIQTCHVQVIASRLRFEDFFHFPGFKVLLAPSSWIFGVICEFFTKEIVQSRSFLNKRVIHGRYPRKLWNTDQDMFLKSVFSVEIQKICRFALFFNVVFKCVFSIF